MLHFSRVCLQPKPFLKVHKSVSRCIMILKSLMNITIYVRQTQYDPDIIEKIDAICREYEPALEGQNGWILVTTDFSPPRE